jgi:hypothetical protein
MKNSRYEEFLKIVKDNPEWRAALSRSDNEVGENSLRALLAVLAITGFVTSAKVRVIIDVLGALLVVSLYLKKNVLNDPKVRAFIERNLEALSNNSKKYFEIIYTYFESKVRSSKAA